MKNLIRTDQKTYLRIIAFIYGHKGYYTNNKTTNSLYEDEITISFDHQYYSILNKFENKFFDELILSLKNNNCDKNVITAFREI